jgi:hypothetical protein
MFGGQQLVGKGLQALGATDTGRALIEDAARRQAETQARVAPFKQQFPIATGAGELGTEAILTAPLGGMIAKPVAALATRAPALAPVANALRTSGFSSGLATQGAPMATRAAEVMLEASRTEQIGADPDVSRMIALFLERAATSDASGTP